MPTNDVNLSNLFAELKKCENTGEFDRALKVVNRILETDPDHSKAIKCKIVCQIQLNQFEEALNLIRKQNDDMQLKLSFEKAYCLYRLNNVEESLRTLNINDDPSSADDFGSNELKAQALYRIENFEDCYRSYIDLLKNSSDDYEDERMVNLAASIVGLKNTNSNIKHDLSSITETTYEVIYNKACSLIAAKEFTKAIDSLENASEVCKKFLEEDGASEDEIESELAIIKAQMAYCYQSLQKNDQALRLYNEILRQKLSDPALIAVISNNIVAIHRDQNLFDSKKKLRQALNENAETKMSSAQKLSINFNYCMFMIHTNQFDTCREHLQVFRKKFPKNNAEAILIEAYLCLKEKNESKCLDILRNYCLNLKNGMTMVDLEVNLLLVELLLKKGNLSDCAKVLENLKDEFKLSKLSIISILIQIYEKLDRITDAEKLFDQCIDWHEKHKSSRSILISLYNEAAKFYMNHNKPQIAVKNLEKIVPLQGKNPKIISLLMNAYSMFDVQKAKSLQNELPSIEEILNSVDIEQLENKNWSLGVKYVKKIKDTPIVKEQRTRNKTKRRKILPKNYDPNGPPPDPERWLPKYERSNYRKKKDRKAIGKGTQGAVGDMPEIKPSPKPAASAASPMGPRQQRPTQKKKKKVGRK